MLQIAVYQVTSLIQTSDSRVRCVNNLLLMIGPVPVVHGPVNQSLPVSVLVFKLAESRNNAHGLAVFNKPLPILVCIFLVQALVPVFVWEDLFRLCLGQPHTVAFIVVSLFGESPVQFRCDWIALQDIYFRIGKSLSRRSQQLNPRIPKRFFFLGLFPWHGVLNLVPVLIPVGFYAAFHHIALCGRIVHAGVQLFVDAAHESGQHFLAVPAGMPRNDEVNVVVRHGQNDMGIIHAHQDHLRVVVLVLVHFRGFILHAGNV